MFRQILSIAILCFAVMAVQAQPNTCDGDRFSADAYFDSVKVTTGIKFGSNIEVGGTNQQELFLDFYEPVGDTFTERPLILMAFGGSFVGGSRQAGEIVQLCTQYAKQGYVCAAIDYRVGFFVPNQITTTQAVMRGMHDMKAAVRFFRKDVETNGNSYGIDTSAIIAGGVSAGAITAIHAAYFDKDSEIPAYMFNDTAGIGGVDGNSGNPGYSSKVHAVINFSGAIGDTNWIEPGDPPIISFHDTLDGTVPYDTRQVAVQGFPTGLTASGSGSMKIRVDNIGVTNFLQTYPTSNHVSYLQNFNNIPTVMDSTQPILNSVVCKDIVSGIEEELFASEYNITLYPNPAANRIQLQMDHLTEAVRVELYDNIGRRVAVYPSVNGTLTIERGDMVAGLYFVKINAGDSFVTRKVIFQ